MNKEYKLAPRQVALCYVAFFSVLKFINLPAVTARFAREGLWISALAAFLFDGLLAWLTLFAAGKGEDETFLDCIERAFGRPFTVLLAFLYFLFFLVKAYIPLVEQKYYVEVTLYETSPTLLTFLPFFLVCFYVAYKGLRSFGRCADACVWLTLAAFAVLVSLSLANFDPTELLPVIGVPVGDLAEGTLRTSPWYLDGTFLLFAAGNIRREKNGGRKILFGYAASALLVLAYMCVLYGEFGAISERQFFSPVRMGKFNVALTNIGRVDYFSAFIFALSSIFGLSAPVLLASVCLDRIFRFRMKFIPAAISSACLLAAVLTTDKSAYMILNALQFPLSPWLISLAAAGPVLFLAAKLLPRKKEKNLPTRRAPV